jgi:L-aminopeptidase/D-esterase-like protein
VTAATITAVPGVIAGHWTGEATGVTVVLTPEGSVGGVVVPGSAPGTRELSTLSPTHLAGAIHGVCLSGGSAFGLASADGVMRFLAEQGKGFAIPGGPVPIVPAAILFDLDKGAERPGAAQGYAAAEAASAAPLETGRVGAARGASVARTTGSPEPGWLGSAAVRCGDWTVGAVVALNALGSIVDPCTGAWLVGGPLPAPESGQDGLVGEWRGQTTLVCVATDAPLSRAQCQVVAQMAAAGLARCIRPAFTPFDGDVVFALSTGTGDVEPSALLQVGEHASRAVEQAIVGQAVSRTPT